MQLHVTRYALRDPCRGVRIKSFSFLLLFFLFGCSPFPEDALLITQVREHQLRSDQIRRIMHELDNALYLQNKSEIERDDERRVMLLSLSQQIERMSLKMRQLVNDENLSACDEDRNTFETYAIELGEQGKKMRTVADTYAFEQLDPLMTETRKLCMKCHRSLCVDVTIQGTE